MSRRTCSLWSLIRTRVASFRLLGWRSKFRTLRRVRESSRATSSWWRICQSRGEFAHDSRAHGLSTWLVAWFGLWLTRPVGRCNRSWVAGLCDWSECFYQLRSTQAESSEIRVRTERGVANDIRTGRIVGSTRRISGAGSDGLRVTVPVAVFPWQAYRSHPGDGELVSDAELYWAGMDFRRNFKWFARESMVGGGLNYPVVAMETILNKGRASREIHDYLLERRYLSRRGASWVLELPSISGAAVVANEVTEPQYRDLLVDLVLWSSSSRG